MISKQNFINSTGTAPAREFVENIGTDTYQLYIVTCCGQYNVAYYLHFSIVLLTKKLFINSDTNMKDIA